jgi:FeS assembly SUF system regulator
MLRMGKLTDYGTVLLGILASDPGTRQTAAQLATGSGIAAPTVSKLLKQLQRAGLVTSERGLHGGYCLARSPHDISAAAILDALEGPMALTTCSTDHGQCGIEGNCRVGSAWQRVNQAIHQSLQAITLSELAGMDKPDTHLVAFNLRLLRSFNTGHHRP